jgi:mannose-6-phosphate isomerase
MSAYRLDQRRVPKPWGRHQLWPAFADAGPDEEPIGEIWFQDVAPADLLVKYLFTSERLSVQVHPDDAFARRHGHRSGKAECWLILAAEPESTIALGPREPISRDTLRAAALDGRIVDLLDWRPVRPGDFLYAPPGTIHAIGAGITLIEVQQNVDLTYRIFDYGRPRELHLDAAVAVADTEPYAVRPATFAAGPMLSAPAFAVHGLEPGSYVPGAGLLVLVEGDGVVEGVRAQAGECWTLDAETAVTLAANARALFVAPS